MKSNTVWGETFGEQKRLYAGVLGSARIPQELYNKIITEF